MFVKLNELSCITEFIKKTIIVKIIIKTIGFNNSLIVRLFTFTIFILTWITTL